MEVLLLLNITKEYKNITKRCDKLFYNWSYKNLIILKCLIHKINLFPTGVYERQTIFSSTHFHCGNSLKENRYVLLAIRHSF